MRKRYNEQLSDHVAGLMLLFLLVIGGFPATAQSYLQKENNIWVTITKFLAKGIDFNTTPPNHFGANEAMAWGGTTNGGTSVSDAAGNLLFYSDGNVVFDRNYNIMPNGWDINNDGTPTAGNYIYANGIGLGFTASSFNFDGVATVKVPGTRDKYYLFTISHTLIYSDLFGGYTGQSTWEGRLRYCIVDMSLNNGLGEVDPIVRSIVIADSMAGNLQVVTGDDCNFWLVGATYDGAYRSFNITAGGIDTIPVVSNVTIPLSAVAAELTISPDRTKLAQAMLSEVQLCDFDPATGSVSNAVSIGTQDTRSLAFSANSSKLYLSGLVGVRQVDLAGSVPEVNLVTMNNYMAYEFNNPLRLAPDNKIYGTYYTTGGNGISGGIFHLRINQPDQPGVACQMDTFNFPNDLIDIQESSSQFPNEVAVIRYDSSSQTILAPLCFNEGSRLLQLAHAAATDIRWIKNTTGGSDFISMPTDATAIIIDEVGIYVAEYFTSQPCSFHSDTFIVNRGGFSLDLASADTLFSCDRTPVLLQVAIDSATCIWQDGTINNVYEIAESGMYSVTVTRNGCRARDSVQVQIMDISQDLGADTIACAENTDFRMQLEATLPPGSHVLWSTGSEAASIEATGGVYWVEVTNGTCIGRDTVLINRAYCDCPLLIPNAFTPNNDGLNDHFGPMIPGSCAVSDYKLQIYSRWGEMVYVGYRQDEGWDGTYKGKAADAGTYFFRLSMKTGLNEKETIMNGDIFLLR